MRLFQIDDRGFIERFIFTHFLSLLSAALGNRYGFPWQELCVPRITYSASIQKREQLVVGTINNAFSYFVSSNGAAGLEYELTKRTCRLFKCSVEYQNI